MRSKFQKYEFLVGSESRTRTGIMVVDKQRMIRALELCLKHVRVRDTKGRDCFNPAVLCFVNDLKHKPDDLLIFQTTQQAIFDIWFFICLVVHGTELGDSEDVCWAFTQFNHFMLVDGTDHPALLKEIL